MKISDAMRTEEITEYEAQCLKASFLGVDDGTGNLKPTAGVPVGRDVVPVTKWDLIDRLLSTVTVAKTECRCGRHHVCAKCLAEKAK